MTTKLGDELKVKALWAKLDGPWSIDDPHTLVKTCAFFGVCVWRKETNNYGSYQFMVSDTDGRSLYEQTMKATEQEEAMREGDQLLFDFMFIGFQHNSGIALTRPSNEIRITQIAVTDGSLHGVGEDKIVYVRRGSGKGSTWEPLGMVRHPF